MDTIDLEQNHDDTMNYERIEYTLSDFFNDNHLGLLGLLMACAIIGMSTGYILLDILIPASKKPEESDEAKRIRLYETSYLDELEALEDETENEDHDKSNDKKRFFGAKVEDETPFGPIIMTYNVDDETYWYYTNNKSIPYKTLDAVARQFAVKYSCKRICVNYREEWEKAKALAIAEQEHEEAAQAEAKEKAKKAGESEKDNKCSDEKKPRDVYAKFKKYNKSSSMETVSKNTQENEKKTRKDSIKRRRYRISAERSNRFTHKGRIADYVDPTIPKSEPAPTLSFAEFKARQTQSFA